MAGCCDRHCADCVSLSARALAYAAWSAVSAHTHTHTGTSTHRRAHILQKHISVRRNSANKQDPHTQLSYSSIYTSYMHLYISGCVYLCCGHIITYSQAWLMATCHSGALSHCGETKHSEALIHRSRRYNAMTIAAKAAANPLSVTPMTPAQ